ncbi:MAG TPA: hypothetical protein VLF87_02480 [Patescibacteria group bacterium]|nr:hypothetical protein [Patescibacteria group bacterium]
MDPNTTPVQPNDGVPAPQSGAVPAQVPADAYGLPAPYAAPPVPPTPAAVPQAAPPVYPQYPAPPMPATGTTSPGQATVGQPGQAAPPPPAKTNSNSTQNTLQIAEIRDGVVIMSDGSFRSVIMVKSINFDLMSPQEQEAVEYSYQGFLNSLYFPIQIFVRSQKVDLGPYLERLDKIRSEHDNMLLALLMEDYINFMTDLSYQTNIMDKKFYVVVPYFPVVDVQKALSQSKNFLSGLGDLFSGGKEKHVTVNEADLNKAKDELRNRVQAVLGGLQQSGVQGLPLDTQELIELFYDTYNPDTATRQQLKNFNDLTVPVVQKGQGQAPQPNLNKELQA